jgi:hypothetical protein
MEASMDERLEQAVATLNELIGLMGANGHGESMMFLEMAKLQLQLDLNGITDVEFIALCDALENGTLKAGSAARPASGYARPRREGDLRGQRRAWHCPQGAPSTRRRRRVVTSPTGSD